MYGHLTVITGPMYASKTTELLRQILWAKNGLHKKVLVVKPSFDNRYSETRIVSHSGLSTDAFSIERWDQIPCSENDSEVIFLDEIQFFQAPYFSGNIVSIISGFLSSGKEVFANGLDMDADAEPFAITATLLAMADHIIKLKSSCSVCGRSATKTHKLISNDNKVELGSSDLYEPRCNEHFR